MTKRSITSNVLGGSVCVLAAGLAWSQDEPAATQGSVALGGLEEIIVTAQKRSQDLQNVPISITAIGSDELERIDSVNLGDFARRVPGLSFRNTGPGQNQIVVRGISSPNVILRPTTGQYLDDTPVSALGFGALDAGLFDLERIEVLRGPQGTLYGGGSMGGTVRFITAKPDFSTMSVRGDVSLASTEGGAESHAVNAGINLPFSDKVALRASGYLREDGGWIERTRRLATYNPRVLSQYQADPSQPIERDVNDQDTRGIRLLLGIQPTQSLSITPSVFYQRISMDSPPNFDEPPGSQDRQLQTRSTSEPIEDEYALSNLTVKYDSGSLEWLSSSSYFERDRFEILDSSTVPLALFYPVQTTLVPAQTINDLRNHAFVEELRVSTNGEGRLNWIAGVYYADNTLLQLQTSAAPGFSQQVMPIPNDLFARNDRRLNTKDKAVFGEISYRLFDTLTATVGLRAFESESTSIVDRSGLLAAGIAQEPTVTSSDDGINPKFQLSWQATPDALVYATAAKGFRAGGGNPPFPAAFCAADLAALGLTDAPAEFEPDTLWNYEVGAKSRWLDNRLSVNGALYHIDWTDVQQSVSLGCGFGFLGNFGSARSRGAEFEIAAKVFDSLLLSTGAGYNEAELTGAGLPGLQGEAGDPLQDAPRWTVNGSADYSVPVGARFVAGATLNYQYTSEVFGSFNPAHADYRRPGYSTAQLNARIGTDRYELSLFVNNLTNTKAQAAFAGQVINIPGVRIVTPLRFNR